MVAARGTLCAVVFTVWARSQGASNSGFWRCTTSARLSLWTSSPCTFSRLGRARDSHERRICCTVGSTTMPLCAPNQVRATVWPVSRVPAHFSPRCHKAPPPLADGKEEDDERTFRPDDQDAAVGALQLAARVHKVCRFAVCTAVQCTCTPGVSKFWRGGANDCVRRATTGNLVLRLPPTPRERDSACSA